MKHSLLALLLISLSAFINAQSVGVGTTSPDSSALLDLSSSTKGFLMPRMTTSQRDAITSPAEGLQILNLDDFCMDIYDGSTWVKHCGMKMTGLDTMASSWDQAGTFPTSRAYAVAFSIGSSGYMGTGTEGSNASLDFWQFDTLSNTWTQKANVGSQVRSEAIGFVVNGKGYIGTGSDGLFTELNDLYEYDPVSNSWTQKSSLPTVGRRGSAAFSIGNAGYVAGGFINGFPNDVIISETWKYTPETDTWVQVNSLPWYLGDAVGFSIGDKGFVGTGFTKSLFGPTIFPTDNFYQYYNGIWTEVSSFGGGDRYSTIGFSLSGKGYVGTGQTNANEFHKDLWEFNPDFNVWKQVADFGGTARGCAVAFGIGNKGYIGTGIDGVTACTDFWEFVRYPLGPVYENGLPYENAATLNDGIWTKSLERIFLTDAEPVGIGTSDPQNALDVTTGPRQGIHPINRPLYITGNIGAASQGIEIRHNNGQQGIGFGYNTIYATGSIANQDLRLASRGNGKLIFTSGGIDHMRLDSAGHLALGLEPALNLLDISRNYRDGEHATNLALYVTGDFEADSNGVEFRHSNASQGIGFGFNTMYAAGNNASQDLGMSAKGTSGNLIFSTNGNERLRITGAGHLGIGITAPNAPLQFATVVENRKLVLYDNNNNDHQFYGFGVNTNKLRYQTESTSSAHVFYAATSSTTSNELMRITGEGRVGLGVLPLNQLDIHSGTERSGTHAVNRPLYITGDIGSSSNGVEFRHNNGAEGIGFGYNGIYAAGENESQYLGLVAKGPAGNLFFTTNNVTRMWITGDGNMGIGTISPNAPLQFSNTLANRKLVFNELANNDHQFFGFGINASIIRYQVSTTTSDHVFFAGASTTTSNELMRIKGNGFVGIGVSAPNAPLQFSNATANRKIVLTESNNNDHQFSGFGINASTLRYQSANTTTDHVFFAGTSATTSSELMRIKGNGNVGIGTSTPDQVFSVANKLGIAATGSIHFKNDVSHMMYMYTGASTASKMAIAHSPAYPDWGLQYDGASNKFNFLKDSSTVMSVNLGANNVEVAGNLKIGYAHYQADPITINGYTTGSSTCNCPAGTVVISGGFNVNFSTYVEITSSWPSSTTAWTVNMNNPGPSAKQLTVYAICARLAN